MAWHIIDGELTNTEFISEPEKVISKPYPLGMWRIEGGELTHALLPDYKGYTGAFEDCAALSRVVIPRSVTTIGAGAFKGTALRRVTIPDNCAYSDTSFPEGCVIERYGDSYGQLCDSSGAELLDCEGKRIYVKGD